MNEKEEAEYRNLVKKMIEVAFKIDKECYKIRTLEPDSYKYPEGFKAAIKLREAADALEYYLS